MKIKYVTAAIILALAFVMVASGQRRAKRPASAPAHPKATPTPTPLSTLSIEAGLVYNNGDVKPVARTQFYLLDEDLRIILRPFHEDVGGPGSLGSRMDMLRILSTDTGIDKAHQDRAKAKYDAIKSAIEAHVMAITTTDFSGKAKFESLEPGTVFVYGEALIGRDRIAWSTRVEIKAGTDAALTLDNNNRTY